MGEALGPNVAGTWYPDDADALARQVDGFLGAAADDSRPAAIAAIAAIVAPHAGFVYSGQVAARGFAGVRAARFDRVLLLGPSHYSVFPGAALPRASAYRTPLGEVPIDRRAADALAGRPSLSLGYRC
jgi:AmmeMemoRadiSam system protein B